MSCADVTSCRWPCTTWPCRLNPRRRTAAAADPIAAEQTAPAVAPPAAPGGGAPVAAAPRPWSRKSKPTSPACVSRWTRAPVCRYCDPPAFFFFNPIVRTDMSRPRISALSLCFGILLTAGPARAAGPASSAQPLLERIKAVSREGEGNVEAAKAWKELVQIGPRALIDVLSALDDAHPEAANWLRSAVDAIGRAGVGEDPPAAGEEPETFF